MVGNFNSVLHLFPCEILQGGDWSIQFFRRKKKRRFRLFIEMSSVTETRFEAKE